MSVESKAPLRFGMPLTVREKNIEYVTNEMRERSRHVIERTVEGVPFHDVNVLATMLAEYADLVDTLMDHGTRGMHTRGCRCVWCNEASRQYWRIANRRRTTVKKSPKQRREERAVWAQDLEGEEEL